MAALVMTGDDPELAGAPLAALLIATGRDGAWHQGRADAGEEKACTGGYMRASRGRALIAQRGRCSGPTRR